MTSFADLTLFALFDIDGEADPELPTYRALGPEPPEYEEPPIYITSVCDDVECFVSLYPRLYVHPRAVQLSPFEVSLLRSGFQLPISCYLPKVPKYARGGVRATVK